ncbi:MAG: hypothetical protein JWM58_3807 [Rhizobium sp.]|nr:hypothetical protein [Rhizobium sp.]
MAVVYIDHDVWKQAQKDAVAGRNIDYRDKNTSGMAIRVRGGKAAWYVMTENFKKRIGGLALFVPDKTYSKKKEGGNLGELEKLVAQIKVLMAEGDEPRVNAIISEINKGAPDAKGAKEKVALRRGEIWTWEQMRDAYLEHVHGSLGFRSWEAQRSALGAAGKTIGDDFEPLMGQAAPSITSEHLAAVVQKMEVRCSSKEGATANTGLAQRKKVVQYFRTLFDWASEADSEQRKMTGLSVNIARLVKMPKPASVNSGKDRKKRGKARKEALATFKPMYASLSELAKTFLWRMWDDVTAPEPAKIALLLQLLTGQRIGSVLTADHIEFVRVPAERDVPWKYVWALGPDKQQAYRLLPLPDIASWCIYKMKKSHARDGNDFLFPQLRRSKGQGGQPGDIGWTMHYSTVKETLIKTRKLDECLPKSFGGTHDSRRCFISHLSEWSDFGFADHMSIERVTHKNEGKETVRQKIYDKNPSLRDKYKVLKTWEDKLLRTFNDDDMIAIANRFLFQDVEDRKHQALTAEIWSRLDERKARLNIGGYDDDEEDD